MSPDERREFEDLRQKVEALVKPDRFLFARDIELMRGKKIRGGIFAGSDSNPPAGWTVALGAGGSAGQDTVTHNLGTPNYIPFVCVIGSTNETFQVGIANVGANSFNVYTSQGAGLVARSIFFIVMLI